MRLLHALAAAGLFAAALTANADTTFYLYGTLANGGTFDGTLDWAPSGGILNLATLTYIDVTTSSGYSFSGDVGTIPDSGEKQTTESYGSIYLISDSSYSYDDVLSQNFSGTFLCGTKQLCGDEIDSQYTPGGPYYGAVSSIGAEAVASGFISLHPSGTPTSVTPEPSSFALLGTGLLGVAGVVKRRLA